jgi:DNA/RNA endonuclease G (NUC1)
MASMSSSITTTAAGSDGVVTEMQQQQQASSAMSDIINNSMAGCVAHVTFRVRCETLGHGEEVYLISILDPNENTSLPSTLLHSGKV